MGLEKGTLLGGPEVRFCVIYYTLARSGLSKKSHFWVPFWYHFGTQSGPKGHLNGTSKIAPKIGRFGVHFGVHFGTLWRPLGRKIGVVFWDRAKMGPKGAQRVILGPILVSF